MHLGALERRNARHGKTASALLVLGRERQCLAGEQGKDMTDTFSIIGVINGIAIIVVVTLVLLALKIKK